MRAYTDIHKNELTCTSRLRPGRTSGSVPQPWPALARCMCTRRRLQGRPAYASAPTAGGQCGVRTSRATGTAVQSPRCPRTVGTAGRGPYPLEGHPCSLLRQSGAGLGLRRAGRDTPGRRKLSMSQSPSGGGSRYGIPQLPGRWVHDLIYAHKIRAYHLRL